MNKKLLIFTIFSLTFISFLDQNSYGKNLDSQIISGEITDTTYSCTITTVSRSVYKDVTIFGLSDSSIKILKKGKVKVLAIKDIRTIKFYGRGFGTGAAIGIGIGFGLGLLGGRGFTTGDGSSQYKFSTAFAIGFILAIPLGLIGGGIGALLAEDQLYVLSPGFVEKRNEIRRMIREYSDSS